MKAPVHIRYPAKDRHALSSGTPRDPSGCSFSVHIPEYQTLSSGKITSSCTLSVTTAEPLAFTRYYFLLGLHQLLSQTLKLIQMHSGTSAFSLIPLWKYIFQSNMAYMLFWGADKKQISLPPQVWKSFILWLLRTLGSCALKLVLLFSVFSESERYRNASVLMAFMYRLEETQLYANAVVWKTLYLFL